MIINKNGFVLLLTALVVGLLSGCYDTNDGSASIVQTGFDWLPRAKGEGEILLYDRYDQRFLTYDTSDFSIVEKNDTPNYLQFEFNNINSNIFTTGHSIENHYKIVQKEDKKISILYEMNDNDAIFPLSYQSDEKMFFLKATYDEKGQELYDRRIICSFNMQEKKLVELEKTKGLRISSGTIVNDILYFTVYVSEMDRYKLYKIDTLNMQQIPILIESGLISGDIYNNNDRLWVSDDTKLYEYQKDTNVYPKKALNYFYKDKLLQIQPNLEGNLELIVTDIASGQIENIINNIVDFRIVDKNLRMYTMRNIIDL